MRKELSRVMLELHNVRMEPSNMRKKSKGTTKCEKRIVTYNVGIAQCEDETVKCEKKKSKTTTKCDKRTVTCDIGTAQCEDEIVKCEQKFREPLNVRKELSHVILKLHNVRMESSSVRKK